MIKIKKLFQMSEKTDRSIDGIVYEIEGKKGRWTIINIKNDSLIFENIVGHTLIFQKEDIVCV